MSQMRVTREQAPAQRHRADVKYRDRTKTTLAVLIGPAMLLALCLAQATHAATPDVVSIDSVSLDRPLEAGHRSNLIVLLGILDGWHINSNHPLSEDFIPTRVTVAPPPEVTAGD